MENKGPAKVCTDCYFHTDWASSGGWTGPSYKCDVCGKESWTGYAVHWNHLNAAKVDEKIALAEAIAKEGMTVARFVQAAADVVDLAVSQQGKGETQSEVPLVTSVTLDQIRNPVALTTLRKRAENMLKLPEPTGWRTHKRGYIWVQPATLISLLIDHDLLVAIAEAQGKPIEND